MNQEKIKIASETYKPPYYWRVLMPVVEFCLERGCRLGNGTPEQPFHTDRDGVSSCRLIGPVKIREIRNHFEFPEHFEIGEKWIRYSKLRLHLHLLSEEDYRVTLKDYARRKEKLNKRVLAGRKRRAERNKLSSQGGK